MRHIFRTKIKSGRRLTRFDKGHLTNLRKTSRENPRKTCNKEHDKSSQSVGGAEPKETTLIQGQPKRERPAENTEQAPVLGVDDGWLL